MRFDARSAAVLERASRGPAAMALRIARSRGTAPVSNVARLLTTRGGPARLGALCLGGCKCGTGLGALAAVATPAKWQVDPTALRQLVSQVSSSAPAATVAPAPVARAAPVDLAARVAALRSTRLMGFGSLGFSPVADQAVSAVGSKAGAVGASALATAAGYGAVAGPIGVAAGVVIALAISLFSKNYFNVGASNQLCAQLESLFQKYTTIQGYVAGRALGWQTMNQLMHAATGAGLFPGNDMHLSFHEGTLQCAGHGDWVDAFTGYTAQGNRGGSCGAHNCMADALQRFNHANVPAGTPDAVYFVDAILLPMNDPAHAKIPWVYNGAAKSAAVHQLLYDLADAYLAQFSSGTVPYVQYPQSQVGTPTPGALPAPATETFLPPTQAGVPAPAPVPTPMAPAALPAPTQLVPAQTQATPSTQNMTQAPASYPVPGGSVVAGSGAGANYLPTLPAGYTGAATVGAGGFNTMTMLSLGAGLVALALLLPKEKGKRR